MGSKNAAFYANNENNIFETKKTFKKRGSNAKSQNLLHIASYH
jgi:hypothetical protein